MRTGFSELEFQFALMMGYYTLFSKQDSLNLYLPTASEEKSLYASDWFYENAQGVNLYLQFKRSEDAIPLRKNQRREYFANIEHIERRDRNNLYRNDIRGVYEFKVYTRDRHQQHNLLYSKNSIENSLGYYVAPIFTSRFELQSNLKEWLKGKNFSSQTIYKLLNGENITPIRLNESRSDFGFFKDVIYIKPHEKIDDTASHHYCFNRKLEVSFHSEIQPLKNNGFDFSKIIKDVNVKLKKGGKSTTTLLETADRNLNELKVYFEKDDISEIRSYKIDKILDTPIKDSKSILSILDSFREKKEYSKYVSTINQLYQEIFDIQVTFIYPIF